MTSYLAHGWYASSEPRQLRQEVVDGAMDAAGMLLRSSVPPGLVARLAIRVRSLATTADPQMRGGVRFDTADRETLVEGLRPLIGPHPELDAFVSDCMAYVGSPEELNALYLHLIHVTRMLQLLSHAMLMRRSMNALGAGLAAAAATPTSKKPTKKKPTKKKPTKKKSKATRRRR